MTQKDKKLLLQDLCARLPYGVKVQMYDNRYAPTTLTAIDIKKQECVFNFNVSIENCRPYLRPMASMTEEEKDRLQLLHDIICDENYGDGYSPSAWSTINEWVDYCNSRHLDYHGLIPMGLALEALENMYSIELK